MRYIADFHLHSSFSRATSSKITLESMNHWAKIKGINILSVADFTHPVWYKTLKKKLEETAPGLYQLKNFSTATSKSTEKTKPYFILTTELSCIYSQKDKTRRLHLLVFAPNLLIVEKINQKLGQRFNLSSDGRPILGISAKELLKIILDISPDCFVVPCHAWTPWYAVFGSKSGFDSIEECFEEQSKNIFALETGLSCYDEKTEVLTDNGWKKFTKIQDEDKICTLNPKNNKIEFQKPLGKFAYDYKGKMYRLKTGRVDLLVTPNHKLFVSGCDFRKPPNFFLEESKFLFNKSKRFKKDGTWTGKNIKYFTLPAVKMKWGNQYHPGNSRFESAKKIPIKPWLKFFGFWLAEGWTNEDGASNAYNIYLSNRNNNLLSEMKKILEGFGYNVYWDKKINYTLRVRNYQLFYYLKQFGKSYNKFIPKEVKCLSKELLKIFFEYYIKGDGHIYGRNREEISATTSSIRLRDDLQEIALKMGMSAHYKLEYKKGRPLYSLANKYKKIYKQKNDAWVIYFIRHNLYTTIPSMIKKYHYIESWVNYKGKVYSLAVPNHVIYVRRNGIPVWCGNSDPPMNWLWSKLDKYTLISNSDAHSEKNFGREANVFNLTELSYKNIINAIKTKRGFDYTIEFYPEEGKYHWDGHRDCNVFLPPEEAEKTKNICPKCGKPLTIGVLHRVKELADRKEPFLPPSGPGFKNLIPLAEIISQVLKVGKQSKKVENVYFDLIKKGGSEFNILLDLTKKELEKIDKKISEAIILVREGKVIKNPGYDGVYGEIKIKFLEEDNKNKNQKTLF